MLHKLEIIVRKETKVQELLHKLEIIINQLENQTTELLLSQGQLPNLCQDTIVNLMDPIVLLLYQLIETLILKNRILTELILNQEIETIELFLMIMLTKEVLLVTFAVNNTKEITTIFI